MLLQNALGLLVLGLTLGGQVQSEEIIGGHEAVAHSRPYMVLLKRLLPKNVTLYCDGFLISDEIVLTAAHCQASIYFVYVGLHKFINSETPRGLEVSRAVPHEHFNVTRRINDLMLLKLSKKVPCTEHVRAIKLASKGDVLPQNCTVSGWGYTKERQEMAHELREVNVTIIENKKCAEHKSYCSLGEIGPYHGDSGGPLVCEDEKAFGLVSHRVEIGHKPETQTVNVFGKIPDYLHWIDQHLKKLNVTRKHDM